MKLSKIILLLELTHLINNDSFSFIFFEKTSRSNVVNFIRIDDHLLRCFGTNEHSYNVLNAKFLFTNSFVLKVLKAM